MVLQVPPTVLSVSVVILPAHTCRVPKGVAGIGFTFIRIFVKQPVDNIYSTVTVSAFRPRSLPVLSIVAVEMLSESQLPPIVESPKAMELPTHTVLEPIMAEGKPLNVNAIDAVQPVPKV